MLSGHTNHRLTRTSAQRALIGVIAVLGASCDEPSRAVAPTKIATPTAPLLTAGVGSTPTFLGQATYRDFEEVKRSAHGWKVGLQAEGGLEVIVRSFSYDPGSFTGWHKHPGPVLIQVIEGTVTFFEADHPCKPITVTAGHGYLDTGESGHIGRNLSGAPAKDLTIYLAPPGTQVSQLRIDMDEPAGAAACSGGGSTPHHSGHG
jgi:hypothetical protein